MNGDPGRCDAGWPTTPVPGCSVCPGSTSTVCVAAPPATTYGDDATCNPGPPDGVMAQPVAVAPIGSMVNVACPSASACAAGSTSDGSLVVSVMFPAAVVTTLKFASTAYTFAWKGTPAV